MGLFLEDRKECFIFAYRSCRKGLMSSGMIVVPSFNRK